MKIIKYRTFNTNTEFVKFQKENSDIQIISVLPYNSSIDVSIMNNKAKAKTDINVFVTYFDELEENLNAD